MESHELIVDFLDLPGTETSTQGSWDDGQYLSRNVLGKLRYEAENVLVSR